MHLVAVKKYHSVKTWKLEDDSRENWKNTRRENLENENSCFTMYKLCVYIQNRETDFSGKTNFPSNTEPISL